MRPLHICGLLTFLLLQANLSAPLDARADVELIADPKILEVGTFKSPYIYDWLKDVDLDIIATDTKDYQTLSLYGREDLIAPYSRDFKRAVCPVLDSKTDPIDAIVSAAQKTSIVIINESHERSEHRGFISKIAAKLRPLGYTIFAAETFSNGLDFENAITAKSTIPYFEEIDGTYLSEAGFGRLGRKVKSLGYKLYPYEDTTSPDNFPDDILEQIHVREEAQATNLAKIISDAGANAKILIHVGYSHALETTKIRQDGREEKWMAARLKEKTGIDPLTISQTTCYGNSTKSVLASAGQKSSNEAFDILVDHPEARFHRGRPVWRRLAGDRAVRIPKILQPKTGWHIIEARPVGEPTNSVPMDRVLVGAGEDVVLMLPSGRYAVRAFKIKLDNTNVKRVGAY